MVRERKQCPECRGSMVEGFVPEYTSNRVTSSFWIEGKLERSFWAGMKLADRDLRGVVTWRCTRCGLLRSYAEDKIDPPGVFG